MQQLTTTPFGRRRVTSGLIASAARAAVPAADDAVDKWQVFRDLTTARAGFGLPSRALTVLSALLSFHPETELCGDDPIIVFPSNRRLAERAHGMAEATLRRHLAALTEAGLILRHDSPNGKRYAARDGSGALSAVFGFDLRPLLVRAAEIAAAARATRDAAESLRRKRECLVLLIRDCDKLAAFIGARDDPAGAASHTTPLAGLRAALRRKLDAAALDQLCNCAATIRSALETQAAALCQTVQSSGHDAQTERHIQDSDTKDSSESREAIRNADHDPEGQEGKEHEGQAIPNGDARYDPGTLSLGRVLAACPSLSRYLPEAPRDWPEFHRAAAMLRPWLGITAETWAHAIEAMGPTAASVCLVCLLERSADIRSPGAYLRRLSLQAASGGFAPETMVAALAQRAKLTAVNSRPNARIVPPVARPTPNPGHHSGRSPVA